MTTPAPISGDELVRAELSDCPFCGGIAHVISGAPGCHFVKCERCGASTNDVAYGQAVTLWNTRSTPPHPLKSDEGWQLVPKEPTEEMTPRRKLDPPTHWMPPPPSSTSKGDDVDGAQPRAEVFTDVDKIPSPDAVTEEELARVIRSERTLYTAKSHSALQSQRDQDRAVARAVLSHLRAKRKESEPRWPQYAEDRGDTSGQRIGQFVSYLAAALECDGKQAAGHSDGRLVVPIDCSEELLNDLSCTASLLKEMREALEQIAGLEPAQFAMPEGWGDAIKACPECQRYADHPIQQGICNLHRKPIYQGREHDEFEAKAIGSRARMIARAAIAKAKAAETDR